MSITTVRILSAIALFCCTVLVGALPPIFFEFWRKRKQQTVLSITNVHPASTKKTKSWFKYNNIIKILMFFGGGVLLATCFIHLIPEVRQNLDHFFQAQKAKTHDDHDHDHGHDHSHNHAHADHHHGDAAYAGKMNGTDDDAHGDEHVHDHDHDEPESGANVSADRGSNDHDGEGHGDHSHGIPYVELAVCLGFFLIYLLEELVHTFIGCSGGEDGVDRMTDEVSSTGSFAPPVTPFSLNKSSAFSQTVSDPKQSMTGDAGAGHQNFAIDLRSEGASIDDLPPGHPPLYTTDSSDALVIQSADFKSSNQPQSTFLQPRSVRFLQGFVVIVAFSAHSIFDGVAVGLQEETSSVWTMFFAICSHKLVVALAVGMEVFEKTQSLLMTCGLMSLFSAMSPLGILLVVVTETRISGTDSPVIILLSAVATGTILYIVFFEILQRERTKDTPKLFGLLLYLSMVTGFGMMFYVTLFIAHH